MAFADAPEDFEFSICFVLGRVSNSRFKSAWRALPETERHIIARQIREYLELSNWRYHRGPPAEPHTSPLGAVECDPFEEAIDDAIFTCDGDLRATIKALLIANSYLEAEMRIVQDAAPRARGRMFREV